MVNVRVLPRASKNRIQGVFNHELKIQLQAAPVKGAANQALIRFLSKEWNLPKSSFELVSGDTGRHKRLMIYAPTQELMDRLKRIPSLSK